MSLVYVFRWQAMETEEHHSSAVAAQWQRSGRAAAAAAQTNCRWNRQKQDEIKNGICSLAKFPQFIASHFEAKYFSAKNCETEEIENEKRERQ